MQSNKKINNNVHPSLKSINLRKKTNKKISKYKKIHYLPHKYFNKQITLSNNSASVEKKSTNKIS
jgi:hypothetical protein